MKADKVNAASIINIMRGFGKAQVLYVAHEIGLFQTISDKSALSMSDICSIFNLTDRAAQALISMCLALGLLEINLEKKYQISNLTKKYLLKDSPYSLCGLLDVGIRNKNIFTLDGFKKALFSGESQVYNTNDSFDALKNNTEEYSSFTKAMQSKSLLSSSEWPKVIDLSKHKLLLDVAGGAGTHSISALLTYPNLEAIILEREFVCKFAQQYIDANNLTNRIKTQDGDMWEDTFPSADLHFYCDVFHDWPPNKCQLLANKSFNSLPLGGLIILHEMLFDDDKTGPSAVASYNLDMLMWTNGQQYSGKEITSILKTAGFSSIQIIPTNCGNWKIITGEKLD